MEIITVALHKGGVGKTTTSVNLSAGLARRGFKVLLLDLDPQAHATYWFTDAEDEIEFDLHNVIVDEVPMAKAILPTRIDNLDLLPSTLGLAELDVKLNSMTRREDRITKAISEVDGLYDFVIIDLAPNLSMVNVAALVSATRIISPVSAKKLSILGLSAFLEWTTAFREEGLIHAELFGVLLTMTDDRTRISREVTDGLRATTIPVFTASIPYRVGAEDLVAEQLVTGDQGDPNMMAIINAYSDFVDEFIAKLGVTPRG